MSTIVIHTEDLDSTVKRTVLDIIDFNFRFKNDEEKSVKEVIEDSLSTIEESISSYYAGLSIEIDINLDIELLEEEYMAVMV